MNSHRPSNVKICRCAILICLLLTGCGDGGSDSMLAACTNRTRDFSLPDLAGRPHRLEEYLSDRPVLLFFFTSWCPACRSQIPELKEIERRSDSLGVRLVTVGAGLGDTSENVRAYATAHRLPYVVLYDDGSALSEQLGVTAVPAAFLIRQDRCTMALGSRVTAAEVPALLKSARGPSAGD